MSATSLLFILVGIFILINAGNIVGVIQGNTTISLSTPISNQPVGAAKQKGK